MIKAAVHTLVRAVSKPIWETPKEPKEHANN